MRYIERRVLGSDELIPRYLFMMLLVLVPKDGIYLIDLFSPLGRFPLLLTQNATVTSTQLSKTRKAYLDKYAQEVAQEGI